MIRKNKNLDKIANKVLAGVEQPKDLHGIDPITIIIVIGVILSLIRVIQECRKQRTLLKDKHEASSIVKRDIQDLVLKDNWFNNLRLKRIIKQHLSKDQYKVYGKNLQNSLMEVGVNLTDDEVYTLVEAAND